MNYKKEDKKILRKLYERIKELKCLYSLSRLVERHNLSLEEIFKKTIKIFPESWQYPSITCARIEFEDKEFKTPNFKKTKWGQAAVLKKFGRKLGRVEVYYLKQKPRCYEGPFLKEERGLMNAIAERLGNFAEHKEMEDILKQSEARLRQQKLSLEKKNIALREIIEQIEIERNNIREDIMANLNETVFPILEKLRVREGSRKYVDLLKYHLEALTSSFGTKITKRNLKITPREIEICNMIKANLTSKEIARLLNVSLQTVETHRRNIRKKFKLSNKKLNTVSFLRQL